MNFLDAVRVGKPIRRTEWVAHTQSYSGGDRDRYDLLWGWIVLGEDGDPPARFQDGRRQYPWIAIKTGQRQWLSWDDYLAEDWEVMA